MKATADRRLTQAVLITAADLDALAKAVTPHLPPLTASARCSDNITRHFETVQALTEFDNAPGRAVLALTLKGRSTDYATSLMLSMDSDSSSNVRYSLEGDETAVLALDSALQSFLSATRPPYWFLARLDFTTFFPILLGALLMGAFLPRALRGPSVALPRVPSGLWSVAIVLAVAASFLPFLLSKLFNRLRASLFPMSVFCWAQGLKRHKERAFLRTVIVLGLVISVAGSVVAAILMGR